MISSLASDLSMFIKNKKNMTNEDRLKIKYGIEVLFYETIKILFLVLFFQFIGQVYEFLFAFIILSSIRSFSGGMHFTKNTHCFIFSITFFIINVVVLPSIIFINNTMVYMILSPICLTIIYYFSPITSKFRPITKLEHKKRAKHISLIITTLWLSILFIFLKDSTLFITGIWTIFLQSLQLLISGVMKNEDVK